MIKDSGCRQEFESGAVRDIQKGKGRCDLLPLDVVSKLIPYGDTARGIFYNIDEFMESGCVEGLYKAISCFCYCIDLNVSTMLLEVSIHFEEGAEKYGENNWQKGLPAKCYINSALRHLLKWFRGDDDERHDRAFVWNLMCCAWTCIHKPELNSYAEKPKE